MNKEERTTCPVTISMDPDLLTEIDSRAHSLDMTRSKYLARLAEGDIAQGGPLTIHPKPVPTDPPKTRPIRYKIRKNKPQPGAS